MMKEAVRRTVKNILVVQRAEGFERLVNVAPNILNKGGSHLEGMSEKEKLDLDDAHKKAMDQMADITEKHFTKANYFKECLKKHNYNATFVPSK